MNTTIPNNGLPTFTQATGSQGSGQASAATATATSANAAPQVDDQLRLTDSARALQEASRQGDTATVDQQQVERVRQAIADGSYRINPDRIADRMLSLERQIGGTDKA